jgi:hypothetical protein
MNYCSIEDAWGKSNCVSNNNYTQNDNNDIIEHFDEPKHNTKKTYSKKNNTNTRIDELNCEDFLLHIKNCRKCYNKVKHLFKPQLIENFERIIDENRDTVVLILIGIAILLFFNLINNVTRN